MSVRVRVCVHESSESVYAYVRESARERRRQEIEIEKDIEMRN